MQVKHKCGRCCVVLLLCVDDDVENVALQVTMVRAMKKRHLRSVS